MSLHIALNRVAAVLLSDGWHYVSDNSFDLDAYEFHDDGRSVLMGGQVAGVCSTGGAWQEASGTWMACPLTAILAVQLAPAPKRANKSTAANKGLPASASPQIHTSTGSIPRGPGRRRKKRAHPVAMQTVRH